ncbi:hypothetical protein SSX86_002432 [Deinandra increscens subsp. villosa]|uniref:Uncharacterized protein n=1 Tax=Deinandra increscens subsp. villosa TaxID=3103831 RepID=A0AAP0HD57_9ASTR
MEGEGSKALKKRPCEDLVQAASDMTAAASSGRKAIKPHYGNRFQFLNRRSATAASSSSGRRDARLEVPSPRYICKFPPEYLAKGRTVPERVRRAPPPKVVCGGPAKPFVMPPEVRGRESYGDDFFRELIMANPSYKAAVAAGYKVEIRGRVWKAELPSRGNREEGYGQYWVGDRLVLKLDRRAAPTKVCGGLASDTTMTAAASGRKDLKHPFEDHVEDPNSLLVERLSSALSLEMEDEDMKN